MPGIGGKQTLNEIKGEKELSWMEIVLLSTCSSETARMFAAKENIGLITKPSSEAIFRSMVKRIQIIVRRKGSN
jgi:DNA-binding response OmpR family regulator